MFLPDATMTAMAKAKGRSSFGNAGGRSSWKRVSMSAYLASASSPEAGSGRTGHAGGRLRQGHLFFHMRRVCIADPKRPPKPWEVRESRKPLILQAFCAPAPEKGLVAEGDTAGSRKRLPKDASPQDLLIQQDASRACVQVGTS